MQVVVVLLGHIGRQINGLANDIRKLIGERLGGDGNSFDAHFCSACKLRGLVEHDDAILNVSAVSHDRLQVTL
jgi:hypothetical protein